MDEPNSQIGVLICTAMAEDNRVMLREIQHDLFNLGAELSWPAVAQIAGRTCAQAGPATGQSECRTAWIDRIRAAWR